MVNFFLSILHLLYIIYPNFTCVEFGIQIRTHKVAEYRIRIQNTTCDGNPAGKICQHVTTSCRQDLPACHYITPARFASMLLHTASMLFHTASKICQYVATYHQQDSPACCYILPACRFIPPARFFSMSLHTTSNICQHVATYRQHVATYTQQDLPACRYIPPARYASMSLHTAGKICQYVAATYRRQDLPACQCIPLTSFLSVSQKEFFFEFQGMLRIQLGATENGNFLLDILTKFLCSKCSFVVVQGIRVNVSFRFKIW